MKVITLENPTFSFVPRFNSSFAALFLDNGIAVSNMIANDTVTFLDTTVFVEGQTYSFTISSEEGIVYKGKLIYLKDGTDIQNYNAQSQDTKRWM